MAVLLFDRRLKSDNGIIQRRRRRAPHGKDSLNGNHMMNSFKVLVICIQLPVLFCAHRQAPSGGPDDTTGPSAVIIKPASGSVNVPQNVKPGITFSEWLLPASDKGVSIFPSLPLKVRVKGKKLEIKPLEPLNDSTTYHLVITSALKDLRNNQMSRPLSIIFSTGPTLDSGSLSGCVTDPSKKYMQPNVVLFGAPWKESDSGFCGPPTYLTQTDSTGFFSFEHIRTGTYYLLAYIDKNNDSRLKSGVEECYTSAESTVVVGKSPVTAVLYPSSFDTAHQSISSAKAVDNHTVIGYWKQPWDTLICPEPPRFSLEPADTGAGAVPMSFHQSQAPTRFILTTDSVLDSTSYLLIYTVTSIFDTAETTDTLRIDGAAQTDTTAPFISRVLPLKAADLKPEIRLIWSEPVYLTDTLLMVDTLGDSVTITGDTSAMDTSLFTVPRSLLPNRSYSFVLFTGDGKDLSGNPLRSRDSTDTVQIVTISTIKPDSIAVSLSGGADCLEKNPNRKWIFRPLAGDRSFTVSDNDNSFRFDSLPASKGCIGSFIDHNSNDRPENGRLIPFIPPEPFIMFTDTIEARARWDVEGIELTPCDPCLIKKIQLQKDSIVAAEK